MKGRLDEISLVGLVKLFYDGRQSGYLKLLTPDGGAGLYFDDGELRNIRVGAPCSADGIYDIFLWGDGEFEFAPGAERFESNFDLPTERFIELAEEHERRWRSFAKLALETQTIVKAVDRESAGPDLEREAGVIMSALKRNQGGLPLLSLAQGLGVGLLAAAEIVKRLYEGGYVTLEAPSVRVPSLAIQNFVNSLLRNYEVFAGKVLNKKLISRILVYSGQLGLPVTFDGRGLVVDAAASEGRTVELWRRLFSSIISEMSGPVGGEIAGLLWEKTLASIEPGTAALIRNYGGEEVGGARDGGMREKG
jgi:hypothetical protein